MKNNDFELTVNFSESELMDISHCIAKIYHHSQGHSIEQFKTLCFNELQKIIKYDAAVWATRSNENVVINENDTYCYNLPKGFMANYESLLLTPGDDSLAKMIFSNPGKTIPYPSSKEEQCKFYQEKIYLHHCSKYNIEQGLATMTKVDDSDLFHFFSLYRTHPEHFFNQHDAGKVQMLLPHLMESFRLALLSSLHRDWKFTNSFRAVCDRFGTIIAAEDSFYQKINANTENWDQKQLPVDCVTLQNVSQIKLGKARLEVSHIDNFYYVELFSPEKKFQQLSKREKQVARLLPTAILTSRIASELDISPKTVDIHLGKIYKKLDCSNKHSTIAYLTRNNHLL